MKASSPVLGNNVAEERIALDPDQTNFAPAVVIENEAILRFELSTLDLDRIRNSDKPSVYLKVSLPEGIMPNVEIGTVPPVLGALPTRAKTPLPGKMEQAFEQAKKGTILEDHEKPTR
jgi:hypothetical protein